MAVQHDGIRLSALVVARNEAAHLEACLFGLQFADEIVVVLDRTSDQSARIARCARARVVEGAWPLQADRRNAGLEACRGAWILEIDADERVSPMLAREIRRTIQSSQHDHHLIPVDNFIGARRVRYGWGASIGKSAYVGLFRAGAKRWGRGRVHPKVALSGDAGPPLQERLIHYVDDDVGDLLRRFDRYTSSRAEDLRESGELGSIAHNLLRIPHRFHKCFWRRQGWREGALGFLIATLAALYPLVSYIKACELTGQRWRGREPRPAMRATARLAMLASIGGPIALALALWLRAPEGPQFCSAVTLADANADGRVAFDEYAAYQQRRAEQREQARVQLASARPDTDIYDSEADLRRRFDQRDLNRDGVLTEDEWDVMVRCP